MVRNVVGGVLAVIGAAAALASPFREWYDTRLGREYRLSELFESGGLSGAHPNLLWSLFLPFLVAAVLTLAGVLARARLLVLLAGVLVLGFTVLWMVRAGQANGGSLTLDSDGTGLGQGVAGAAGGGLLLLIAAAVMSGRTHRRTARHGETGDPAPYRTPDDDGYGTAAHDPYRDYRDPDETPTTTSPYGYGPDDPQRRA